MPDPNPDDPVLKAADAPHEPSVLIRMHRRGWPGDAVCKLLSLRTFEFIDKLNAGLAEEQRAFRAGRKVTLSSVPHGFKYPEDKGV